VAPGAFDDYDRGTPVLGVTAPPDLSGEHLPVQFSAPCGSRVNLQCPGAGGNQSYEIHGPLPSVKVVQQRWVGSLLATVCQCGGCGLKWRLSSLAEAEPIIEALRSMAVAELATADRYGTEGNRQIGSEYEEIARRIQAGYEAGDAALREG
jgi:hypothetical protein